MKKKLLILLAVLLILLIAAPLVWLQYFWDEEEQKIFLEQRLTSALHRPVNIEKANLKIFPRAQIVLTQVDIKDRDGKSNFVSLQRLRMVISLRHLFSRTLYFSSLSLDKPRFTFSREPQKGFNFSDLLKDFPQKKVEEKINKTWLKTFGLSLEKLQVSNGEVAFKDSAIAKAPVFYNLSNLSFQTGKITRAGLIPIFLRGILKTQKNETPIHIKGEMAPVLELPDITAIKFFGDTEVENLNLADFAPYLLAWRKIESPQGTINGKISFQGIWREKFKADGDIAVAGLKLKNGQLLEEKLKIDKANLRFSVTQENANLDFTHIELALPELTLTGNLSLDKNNLIQAELATKDFNYQSVLPYVPFFLFPSQVKTIMTGNIISGKIDKLSFRYSEKPPQLPSAQKTKNIKGSLLFRDFALKIIDEVPRFKRLNGKCNFENRSCDITNLSGTFGNSEIGQSAINLSDSGFVNLAGNFKLDLSEVTNLLHLKRLPPKPLHHLEKIKSMRGTGLLNVKASAPLNNLKSLTLEGNLELLDADIDYKNFRLPGTQINGTFRFDADNLTFTGITGLWARSPFICSGEIKNYLRPPEVKTFVHVESENADINDLAEAFFPWKGVKGNGSVKIFVDFSCNTYRSQNLRFNGQSRFEDLTLDFPAFPHPFTQVEGEMGFSSEGLTFPHIKGKAGSSDISFSGLCEGLRSPKITGKAEGGLVNFLEIYKPAEKKGERKAKTFTLDNIDLTIEQGIYKELNLNNLTSQVSFRNGILTLSPIKATHGALRKLDFTDLSNLQGAQPIPITYQDGVLAIPFLKLKCQEGDWIGKDIRLPLSVDREEDFSLTSEITNFPAQEFLEMFPEKNRVITGVLNLQGKVAGKGKNLSEWMETLNGEINFTLKEGVLKKLNILSKLFSLLNVSRIFSQDYGNLMIKGMPYDILQGSLRIEQGVARTAESIFLDSPAMKMDGVGEINLGKKILNMEVAVQPLETVDKVLGKIPILGTILKGEQGAIVVTYYKLTGTFEEPKWDTVVFGSLGRKGQGIFKQIFKLP